ncbi:MAG: NADH-quinone oxidoreductase subunit N [Bacteroidota bacterium]
MNTLIYTSILGLLCMVVEIFDFRKILVPMIILGLATIFYINIEDWNHVQFFYNNMLRADNYSVAFSGLAIVISAFVFVLSSDFYKDDSKHISDYLAILVFVLCGALIMFSFWNMAMLFLGIEILSISLYIMAGSKRFDVRSNEAGFKYFLMGSFASGFLLFGIALIYGATRSFHLANIAAYVAAGNISPIFYVGMTMMLVAMLFKVAAVPFHFWSPDVYEGAPALVTTLMSTLVKIAAFGAFYRLFYVCFLDTLGSINLILAIVTSATIILGNLTALSQINFKRLLAYSGISHAGYLLLALISMKGGTANAIFYYSSGYAIATIGAFAVAILVFKAMKNENIDAFNGLGKKNPLLAVALTMSMLSLAGIPPFAGFLGKYYIFSEAIKNGQIALTFIAVLNSIIGVYYYFKVILAMYTKPADETEVSGNVSYYVIISVCLLLSVLLGIFPGVLMHLF